MDLLHPNLMSDNDSASARLVNCFVDALNDSKTGHLPRLIVIQLGILCLNEINFYDYGASKIIGKAANWLVNNFNREVEGHRERLRKIKPGALIHGEPKILWVAVFDRPWPRKMFIIAQQIQCSDRRNFGQAQA